MYNNFCTNIYRKIKIHIIVVVSQDFGYCFISEFVKLLHLLELIEYIISMFFLYGSMSDQWSR